jgi:hypothetical protein
MIDAIIIAGSVFLSVSLVCLALAP